MIGASHYRIGGDRLAAGAGRFVADVRVPGMLHAAVLRSPHAHARLVSIDAKRAIELRGVHAVLTASDVPEAAVIPNRVPAPQGTERYLQPAIARGSVRYVGEPVALVVADDRYVAEDALDVPPVEAFYHEVHATTNPLGLRGLGECGNPGLGAAIANAVCDALRESGAGLTKLPVTPALVWEATRGARRD